MKVDEALKKMSVITNKAAKRMIKKTAEVGKRIYNFQIPASINWVYGLGFKVGIFLVLKSFLILRYQWSNLAWTGFLTVFTQFTLAIVMIVGGVTMQSQSMYDDPHKLRRAASKYGIMTAVGSLVMAARTLMKWNFFKNPAVSNWFLNMWNSITKGAGEIGLSLLFWDCDLWLAFCALLYVIADVYLYEVFDDPQSLWGRVVHKFKQYFGILTEHEDRQ